MTQPTVVPWGQCTETADETIRIEAQSTSYTRYQRGTDGRRWIVEGTCDHRGDCLIGMSIEGWGTIGNHGDIVQAKQDLGVERIDSLMDVPVTPEFDECCGADRFTYTELEPTEPATPPTEA